MSGLAITITDRGRAALVAARGTNPITIAEVGVTASSFAPSPDALALPGEFKRLTTFSGEASDDYTIHITLRDDSTDAYELRGFALYLSDGTLFGIYGNGPALIMEKAAASMLLLAVDIAFTASDAKQITFGNTDFLNPPATTERQGVVELATDSEAATGTDTARAVTPKAMLSAVTGWINTRFGNGAPSEFIKGILGSASAAVLRTALGLKAAALKDDGAGNGLDADKLDGQEATYFTNITARLGFTPANKAGDTFTGPITINTGSSYGFAWHSGNDGAGSGMDADLLDGQEGSYYTNVVARLGYTPVNKAGDTISGNLGVFGDIKMGDGRTSLKRTIDLPFYGGGNTLVFRNSYDEGSSSNFDNDLTVRIWGNLCVEPDSKPGAPAVAVSVTGDVSVSRYLTPYNLMFNDISGAANSYWGVYAWGDQLQFTSRASAAGAIKASNFALSWSNPNLATINGNAVWHAGNDGSGSGLDADLLDGQQSSEFLRVDGRNFRTIGSMGSGAADHWFKVCAWTLTGPYKGFQAVIDVCGRGHDRVNYEVHIRGESYTTTFDDWGQRSFRLIAANGCIPTSGDMWIAVWDGPSKTCTLYFRVPLSEYEYRIATFRNHFTDVTFNWYNSDIGATEPTGTYSEAHSFLSSYENLVAQDYGGNVTLVKGASGVTVTVAGINVFRSTDSWLRINEGNAPHAAGVYFGYSKVRTDGNFVVGGAENPVWHAGNDGSGSGLDSDTLDGKQLSDFIPIASSSMPNATTHPEATAQWSGDYQRTISTGKALVMFNGVWKTGYGPFYAQLYVDGAAIAGAWTSIGALSTGDEVVCPATISIVVTGLSAGFHTFAVKYTASADLTIINSGTLTVVQTA